MNHIKDNNSLIECNFLHIKFTRQLIMCTLIILITCLNLVSAATVSENQNSGQPSFETFQTLRNSRIAAKSFSQKLEAERGITAGLKDFNGKGSNVQENTAAIEPLNSVAVDNSFNGSISDGYTRVEAVVVQPDGKTIAGGSFRIVNGVRRSYIARFNADGSLDSGFNAGNAGPNGDVQTIKIQPDGKILIGGFFTSYNGTSRNRVARLNTDGTLDTSFNPGAGADNFVNDILIQPDGKILIFGSFTQFNSVAASRVVRLNSDGSPDTSFTAATISGAINQAALQSDGKILIAGAFNNVGGVTRRFAARLNASGTLDTSFDPGTNATGVAYAIAVQPDGKVLLKGGTFKMIRLNADGSWDFSFTPGGLTDAESNIHQIIVLPDGKILAGGAFGDDLGNFYGVLKFNSDGTLDQSFNIQQNVDGGLEVFSIALTPDGKVMAVGDLYKFGSLASNNKRIARLNANGTIDNAFTGSVEGFGVAETVIQQPDGKILVAGSFNAANGVQHRNIARFNADGSIDSTFNASANSEVLSLVLQPDGKIVIGGFFGSVSGVTANGVPASILTEVSIRHSTRQMFRGVGFIVLLSSRTAKSSPAALFSRKPGSPESCGLTATAVLTTVSL